MAISIGLELCKFSFTVYAKVTRPSVFAGKILVGLVKIIHTQDRLSGEKFKVVFISKHSSLVKLCVVWLNVKTYQTDCTVNNINFRVDCIQFCCIYLSIFFPFNKPFTLPIHSSVLFCYMILISISLQHWSTSSCLVFKSDTVEKVGHSKKVSGAKNESSR